MKIILIKPGMGDSIKGYTIHKGSMEPLQLAILAALTPADIEVVMYDDRVESIPFDTPAGLVAITVDTFTSRRAYAISSEFRKRNIPVILGGIHITLLPDEGLHYADSIVIGDAETVWGSVIRDVRAHKLKPVYSGGKYGMALEVLPKREIFKYKKYLPVSLVQFSRGCIYNCSYCAVARYFKSSHTYRNIYNVIKEIETQNLKRILFVDDNITANVKAAKQLCKALIPLNIKWASQANITIAEDEELLQLMKKSGCVGHLIGFESLAMESLRWFNKVSNIKNFDKYKTAIRTLRDNGLMIWGSFMLGNDFDTPESIKAMVDFAIESKFAFSFFHILMPYPGTPVYDRLKKENRLLYNNKWWINPDFRYNAATFIPRLLKPEELSDAAVTANKRFYACNSILQRIFERKTNSNSFTNFFLYMRLNILLKCTSV